MVRYSRSDPSAAFDICRGFCQCNYAHLIPSTNLDLILWKYHKARFFKHSAVSQLLSMRRTIHQECRSTERDIMDMYGSSSGSRSSNPKFSSTPSGSVPPAIISFNKMLRWNHHESFQTHTCNCCKRNTLVLVVLVYDIPLITFAPFLTFLVWPKKIGSRQGNCFHKW